MTARHEIAHADAQRQARGAAAKTKGEERQRLRDEFAMAALPALIARHRADVAWSAIAPTAYSIADAMMAERGK